jgi:hypothetical protein
MHAQTHILAGWCAGNLFQLTARERLFCMLAGALADLDGLNRVLGDRAYQIYHHTLAHNVLFAAAVSLVLAACSSHRIKALVIYLGLAHLHLAMDLVGSGLGHPLPLAVVRSSHIAVMGVGVVLVAEHIGRLCAGGGDDRDRGARGANAIGSPHALAGSAARRVAAQTISACRGVLKHTLQHRKKPFSCSLLASALLQ